jgi:hypothetical protein
MEANFPPPTPLTSVLALAATMRSMNCVSGAESLQDLHSNDPLVPVYDVAGSCVEEEAASAARVLEDVGERLRRLHAAYGEWQEFDAGAYFDLSHAQTRRLVRVSERATTVHVTFFADLLLPSFRSAEHCWFLAYCPSYWRMTEALRSDTDPAQKVREFSRRVQPEMIAKWTRLCDVARRVHSLLSEDQTHLIAYISLEERMRWRPFWNREPASGVDPQLRAQVDTLSTLTLSTEFPLPATRQPGRLRRLRNNRLRRNPTRNLRWRRLDG